MSRDVPGTRALDHDANVVPGHSWSCATIDKVLVRTVKIVEILDNEVHVVLAEPQLRAARYLEHVLELTVHSLAVIRWR